MDKVIEHLAIKDINVDNTSNDNVQITYPDESRDKNCRQDIDNKHPIIRENITVAASDILNFLQQNHKVKQT